jgi:hypothetical protein
LASTASRSKVPLAGERPHERRLHPDGHVRRAVPRVHAGERARQQPVAREGEQGARHGERHPAHVAEHRHRRAGQEQPAPRRAERPLRHRGERRRAAGQRRAEHPLGDELQREVEPGHAGHGQRHGARHRARRVAHLAARHERALDPGEREHQHHRAPRQRPGRRRRRHAQVLGAHEEEPRDHHDGQRDELGHGRGRVEPRPLAHAGRVHRGEPAEHEGEHRAEQRRPPGGA